MTLEESKQILTILKSNYPNSFKGWDKELATNFMLLWSEAFKNDDVREVVKAVKHIIYTDVRDFPPNIAQVKNEMFKNCEPMQVDSSKAWEMVLRGAKCDYSRAREHFDKLPRNIQKAVGSPSFLVELGYSNRDSVGFKRKEFEQNLKQVLDREKEKVLCGEINLNQLQLNNGIQQLEIERKLLPDWYSNTGGTKPDDKTLLKALRLQVRIGNDSEDLKKQIKELEERLGL